jgi:CoA:oxalate CoA-transferase
MNHTPDKPAPGPLAGFVVLDLTRVLAGPFCAMILGDLGATVIKVEQPGQGDEARHFLPFIGGESAYFVAVNRGKKSIALDLKADADRVVFDKLLSKADVLIENFRPSVLDKLGYGFAMLEHRHPRLVLASISGFGQSGPYKNKGAYDVVVQAIGGMMSITGHPGMPPVRTGASLADLGAGLFAANGIQAALLQRFRTGKGCRVDIAMLDCQIALLENAVARYFATGVAPQPMGARHSGSAPFDAFKAADGYLVLVAGSDHLFAQLALALDLPDLTSDLRFNGRAQRVENQAALKEVIEERLATAPVSQWLTRLDTLGVPAGPVNDIEAMVFDPQVQSRGVLVEVEGRPGVKVPVTPVLLSTQAYPSVLPAAPRLDEHRAEILRWMQET